ncbi:MAG: reverse transcriptase domain-containing protein, partial [Candidatus Thiodiazotropha taylori]|nr:hypothetical protein [Candidatus Thiodiazotropha taylori]MCW4285592.1 reverse transcriptase domain-containing protein [Candidatus Thiodiazotropha taylori]
DLALWVAILLILSGDVEVNPGPGSVDSNTDSNHNVSASSLEMLSNHLSIFHLNIQSIVPKMDLIRSEADAYDILIFTESWLKPDIPDTTVYIENFSEPFRNDRRDRLGGGVLAYVRETITCKRRYDLEINGLEAIWLELLVKSKKLLIAGIYRPPNSNFAYMDLIKESVDRAYNTNIVDIFILGDFNYNMALNRENKITELMYEFNLSQLITDSTHFTEHSSSTIDLILARNTANILQSRVADPFIPDQIRYHCPIVVFLKFIRPSTKSFKRKIWNYKLADYDTYRTLLSESNLIENLQTDNDIDSNVKLVSSAILTSAESAIPNKIITVKASDLPWVTCRIKHLIRKRKRTFRQYRKTNNIRFWYEYKTIRNAVVNELRKSKKEYYDKLDRLLSSDGCDPKLFWKTSKQILNIQKSTIKIPTLSMNQEYAESDMQKANMLNKFFTSQTNLNDANKPLPILDPVPYHLEYINISEEDVRDCLKKLKINKASGPDLISPRLLKEGATILAGPFSIIFNRSLQQGYFPSDWKYANISPIHKKDDKSIPSNYRPISLLSSTGKVMERCVHKHLYNYVISHQLLTPLQSGFVQGDSTTYQLLHTYHTFCEAVDNGKEVRAVFCDISKAFDRVWHKGLLHKISGIGCSEHILKWFSSYLDGRHQRVVLNGQASDWTLVQAGVPQGSILGPLLFLLYINDIVNHIGCSIRLFADDTSLYITVECPNVAAQLLNTDLQTISNWADDWLVNFNANKTLSMIISRRTQPQLHPPLVMNGTLLQETNCHKHLGLTFSSSCNWSDHVKIISEKAWSRLNLLRALKFRISRKSLSKMYMAYVLPLLEYCDSVWDNCPTESKKQLDVIHIEAARIITGATKLCSVSKLLTDLGWETLQNRRNKHKLVILFKILNGLTPSYLHDLLPPLVRDTTTYNLRNSNHFQNFRSHTNLFLNSFFPATIRAWNDLPDEVREVTSVAAFKSRLNRDLNKPPPYYNTGTRIGQILQARLRLGCSSLNADLYRKNIVPSPSCACGGFESAYHFFFVCPRLAHIRRRYLPDTHLNYTVKDFLHGNQNLTIQENERIFLKVQEYIIKSGRFL